jgi:hypothetical protein
MVTKNLMPFDSIMDGFSDTARLMQPRLNMVIFGQLADRTCAVGHVWNLEMPGKAVSSARI